MTIEPDTNGPDQGLVAVMVASAEVVLTTMESLANPTAVSLARLLVSTVVLYAVWRFTTS